jgi:hypothetical protein
MILPRQAWDKHRESSTQKMMAFSIVPLKRRLSGLLEALMDGADPDWCGENTAFVGAILNANLSEKRSIYQDRLGTDVEL